jgi:hypothetical protein
MKVRTWLRVNALYVVSLVGLTVVSAASKAVNQFRFFIYPDSYYYLLIGRDLLVNHRPTGTLGPAGMPFPPPGYAAMKVTFPMLVAFAMAFRIPAESAGHIVAAIAAVLAVPAAFAATWRLLRSKPAALAAAALAAVSYGLTYWSGFVMSDSVSVLLGFVVLALVAHERPDELSNPGDIAAGVVAAFLLMSRPTYAVALPVLVWMGFSAFGWTWNRTATAAVACALPAAVISALWFPPPSLSAQILLRLAPVIAVAIVAAVGFVLVLRRGQGADAAVADQRARPAGAAAGAAARTGAASSPRRRIATAAYYALAGLPLLVYALERAFVLAGAASPFLALGRFVPRDFATVVFVISGAVALSLSGKRNVGGALLASAAILLGVYFWAESRDSRYLIHLLPFLIPVAAATVMLPRLASAPAATRAPRASRARLASIAVVVALLGSLSVLAWRGMSHAEASFLATDYPAEVTARLLPALPADGGMLVSAQPWSYHFRIGLPTWSAETTTIAQFTSYVPADSPVLFLADASMRFHYPQLAAGVASRFPERSLTAFTVPTDYLYGYSSVIDTQPVRLYRLTAVEMRSVAASASAEASGSAATPSPIQ